MGHSYGRTVLLDVDGYALRNGGIRTLILRGKYVRRAKSLGVLKHLLVGYHWTIYSGFQYASIWGRIVRRSTWHSGADDEAADPFAI